jgi:mannose-6-phosphate isomerase-like protein (cupin superfamily)
MQLVLMALRPGEEIGEEVHEDRDQFFRVEEGSGALGSMA